MHRRLHRSRRSDVGASAVEYGLLVALIASIIVLSAFSLGRVVTTVFVQTCQSIVTNNAAVATGSCNK